LLPNFRLDSLSNLLRLRIDRYGTANAETRGQNDRGGGCQPEERSKISGGACSQPAASTSRAGSGFFANH